MKVVPACLPIEYRVGDQDIFSCRGIRKRSALSCAIELTRNDVEEAPNRAMVKICKTVEFGVLKLCAARYSKPLAIGGTLIQKMDSLPIEIAIDLHLTSVNRGAEINSHPMEIVFDPSVAKRCRALAQEFRVLNRKIANYSHVTSINRAVKAAC